MARKKNLALDPNYVAVGFHAYYDPDAECQGMLPVVAHISDTGTKLGRFASFTELAGWAWDLGGYFTQRDAASGDGCYYRAKTIFDEKPPKPIGSAAGGLINSLSSDCF